MFFWKYLIFQQFHASGINEIFKLANLITDRYLGLSIYITTLGSWSNGFTHYPPFGMIKISDSHSFQLLVEMNGIDGAIKLFKNRAKIVRFFSECSIHIMILIQISIIVQFSLESKLQSFNQIKEERFRSLLKILQFQLNTLLEKFDVLEPRNEIHRYVYQVMKTLNLTSKSWSVRKEWFCVSTGSWGRCRSFQFSVLIYQ